MIYLDTIFLSSLQSTNVYLIPKKDLTTLSRLATVIKSTNYITEKQAYLILKLLKQYADVLNIDQTDLITLNWEYPFRVFEHHQKFFIDDERSQLVIDYSYSSFLKKEISKITQHVESFSYSEQHKQHYAALTESNIVVLVEHLIPLNFSIDSRITDYYNTIKSWNCNDYINQYRIDTMSNPNFQKYIASDLGINTPLTSCIIADRSRRYQYYITDQPDSSELTNLIAYRTENKIWVDSTNYSLVELVGSLISLHRLPLLFVFSANDSKKSLRELTELSHALKNFNIDDSVGIYFRMSNADEQGKEFNQLIADNKYNTNLSNTTIVAGIQSTKLPKFFINNDWKPMSVISINNSLSNSKTAVYTNCCDLVISYTTQEPLITGRPWELS